MTSGVTTLGSIITAAQQRADFVNSSFVSDAEWLSYASASYQELYGLIAQSFGDDYFVQTTPQSITTDGTNYLFALNSDVFKILGVDLKMGSRWVTLRTFPFAERNRHAVVSNIPPAGLVLQVFYIPRLSTPMTTSTSVDGVDGWEEYIVTDAAIKAMQKEESDVSVLMAQKQALVARIQEEASRRDAGMPARVADVQQANGFFPARFYGPTNLRYRPHGNSLWLNPDDGPLWGMGEGQ